MLRIVTTIFILCEVVSCRTLDCLCGRESSRTRIVHGKPLESGTFPWIVALVTKLDDGKWFQFCAGTFINDRWILTAAHCLPDVSPSSVYVIKEQMNIQNVVPANVMTVDTIWTHPEYIGFEDGDHNDIAMLRLSKPVIFTPEFSPVCLPSSHVRDFDNLFNIGWGRTNVTSDPSSQLLYIETKQYYSCGVIYESMFFWSKQICTYTYGNGICEGDSGGPLLTRKNGYVTQVGINSWVVAGTCGEYPDVTTRVSDYMSEIQATAAGSNWCRNPNLD